MAEICPNGCDAPDSTTTCRWCHERRRHCDLPRGHDGTCWNAPYGELVCPPPSPRVAEQAEILRLLGKVWAKMPDERLVRLVVNAFQPASCRDLFVSPSDAAVAAALRKMAGE